MAFINSGPNINDFLAIKYQQLQQHADAATTQATSAATQAQAQARLIGTEADANQARLPFVGAGAQAAVNQTRAQTGLLGAQTNETNQLLPGKVALGNASARLTNTQADFAPELLGSEAQSRNISNVTGAANAYGAIYANAPLSPELAENGGPVSPFSLARPALSSYLNASLLQRRRLNPSSLSTTIPSYSVPGLVDNSNDDTVRVGGL